MFYTLSVITHGTLLYVKCYPPHGLIFPQNKLKQKKKNGCDKCFLKLFAIIFGFIANSL